MSEICTRLGQTDQVEQEWLILPSAANATPTTQAFPKPAKNEDGSYIYEKVRFIFLLMDRIRGIEVLNKCL